MEKEVTPVVSELSETAETPRRRCTLSDLALLVAASALSMVLLKIAFSLGVLLYNPGNPLAPQFLEWSSVVGGCVLVPLTLVVLISSLLDRKTPRREIVQGAGFIACVAVWVSAIIPILYLMVGVAGANVPDRLVTLTVEYNNVYTRLKFIAGPMILGVWLALLMNGRRFFGPRSIDRFGIMVGACFVLNFLSADLYYVISRFLRLL